MRKNAKNIILVGLMVAIIEVSKVVLSALSGVELVTFWFMIFALVFGKLALFTLPVFLVIEAVLYPMGSWFIMYLYIWPIITVTALMFRKRASALSYAVISSVFGFCFGAMATPVHMFFYGAEAGFGWWVAGLPHDIVHGVMNFVFMLILFKPITSAFRKYKA